LQQKVLYFKRIFARTFVGYRTDNKNKNTTDKYEMKIYKRDESESPSRHYWSTALYQEAETSNTFAAEL